MSYATVAEFVAWKGAASPTSAAEVVLQMVLDAATEAIDEHCHRTFTPATSATSASRTYSVRAGQRVLLVDDFVGTPTVTVDGVTVDVEVVPPFDPDRPYGLLEFEHGIGEDSHEAVVSARWGWPATPKPVKLATLLLAAKLDQRRQSPNGIERGADDMGFIRILGVDKDVQELLKHFVRVARTFA